MAGFASVAALLLLTLSVAIAVVDTEEEEDDEAFCALQTKQRQTKQRVQTTGSRENCNPAELTGVYNDLHDNNNKIVSVTSQFAMTISPPAPGSPYYVEGVGQDWVVTPADVGPITSNCVVTSIDFNVPNKPSPPDQNVTARFMFTGLMDVSWIAGCNASTVGSDTCGQCGADPVRNLKGPQQILLFGTNLADAGNVWVKIAS